MSAKNIWSKAKAQSAEMFAPKKQWVAKAKAIGAEHKGMFSTAKVLKQPKVVKAIHLSPVKGQDKVGDAVMDVLGEMAAQEGGEHGAQMAAMLKSIKTNLGPEVKGIQWVDEKTGKVEHEVNFAGDEAKPGWITADECLKAIKEAIAEFGAYSYGDKGPDEVMDIEHFVEGFKQMPVEHVADVLRTVAKKSKKYGSDFGMACCVNMQDWDELFAQPGMEGALEGEFK